MDPILSIVIPVYNTEKYLRSCLESLKDLSEFKTKTEIIIVSDASPGSPDKIISEFKGLLNIKYLRHAKNSSVFKARRTGIEASRANYILSLDSDDFLEMKDWKGLLAFLDRKSIDILRYSIAQDKDKSIRIENINIPSGKIWDYFVSNKLWQLAGTIIRKELFLEFFDRIDSSNNSQYINMADDLCYSAGIFNSAKSFCLKNDFGRYCYRVNTESLTRSDLGENKTKIEQLASDYINCKKISYLILNNKRADDFQKLLDSNIPWLLPKIYRNLCSYPDTWIKFSQAFTEETMLVQLIEFDISSAARILNYLLSRGKVNKSAVKNVAIVVTKLNGGGTERMACSIASMLSDSFNVHLITSHLSKNDYPITKNIKLHCVLDNGNRRGKILEISRSCNIDTFVFVDYYLEKTLKDILFFKFHGFNVIAQEHNSFAAPIYTGQIGLMAKRSIVYKTCDSLTCLNKSDLLFWNGLGLNQVSYMPNVLTLEPSFKVKELKNKVKTVLYLGRLNPLKGSNELIQICKQVCKQTEDINFEICGTFTNAKDEEAFKKKLNPLINLGRVFLAGQILDIKEKLQNSDLLILPSFVEGSPMVIGEARALGTPVLMYALQYIDINKNGVVTLPVGNTLKFSETVIHLLSNPEDYKKLSKDCFSNLEKWDASNVKRLWINLLNNLHVQKHTTVSAEVKDICIQIQLAIDYLYFNKIDLKEDKDLKKKLKRYDKLMNIFNLFFPAGSTKRKIIKTILLKLGSFKIFTKSF